MDILYEDNHLIAINKRAGEISQGDQTGDLSLPEQVKLYLKEKYHKPGNVFLGVIHRLDRPTSGVLLFAKTSKALTRMNKLFREDKVKKIYHAIVEQTPPLAEGSLRHYLRKNREQNKSYIVSPDTPNAKEARLTYHRLLDSDHYTLLEIELQTGRHHQIRAQLGGIGCVIRGDLKYGARRSLPDGSISLHGRSISFQHPVTQETITITAPYPKGDPLWEYFQKKVDQLENQTLVTPQAHYNN